MEVCGGDMNVARIKLVTGREREQLWEKISNARKSPLKQAALIGFDTLFLLLFRAVDPGKSAEKSQKTHAPAGI